LFIGREFTMQKRVKKSKKGEFEKNKKLLLFLKPEAEQKIVFTFYSTL
jgi:hypothetical protein